MLAAVERELHDDPVVVVGVHSPKFPAEGDAALVREAVRRHGVTHPVVVDAGSKIWDAYAVRAWPTLVFLRPDGTVRGATSGEPDREELLAAVRSLLDERPPARPPAPLPLRPEPAPPGVLAYPGGVAVAPALAAPVPAPPAPPAALFVADTDHHQVVVCDLDGTERRRFGSGLPGLLDGPAEEARFTAPHGLAVDGPAGALIVADTGNHAVRRVDLRTGTVTTVAGTGHRGTSFVSAGLARQTDLRSPWDVAVHPTGAVLVAMAGSHQLWAVDQPGGERAGDGGSPVVAGVYAGSGREARVDGDLATAAFAQPSGLAWAELGDGEGALFVADSETSAVRRVADGRVETLAGGDLFDFGDTDGTGDEVRFQHPVGIAVAVGGALDGLVIVADTLNHKVKTLDPVTRQVRTLFGDGTAFDAPLAELERRAPVPPDARGAAFCREPEAVAWDGRRVLVADTDNHRVLAVDPATGQVSVLLGA